MIALRAQCKTSLCAAIEQCPGVFIVCDTNCQNALVEHLSHLSLIAVKSNFVCRRAHTTNQ
eukprot:m.203442 g.203442  ORF g.203442 m.203442 type:complete len:61 (-) comp18846_c0_seq9:366-548(-)